MKQVLLIVAAALAVGVIAWATASITDSGSGPADVQQASGGGRHCVRVGGVKWCYAATVKAVAPGSALAAVAATSRITFQTNGTSVTCNRVALARWSCK